MSDTPLTEKRFLELFELTIKKKIEQVVAPIEKKITDLQGFQDYEAKAIEFELGMILKKYLSEKYHTMDVEEFQYKTLNNPFTFETISDLDAAFIVKPHIHIPELEHLEMLNISNTEKYKYETEGETIFVLAEAKHYITLNKIKNKLRQMEIIKKLFIIAKKILSLENPKAKDLGIHLKTIQYIKDNQLLAKIDSTILYFGATFWKKNLLLRLENDVKELNKLIELFLEETNEDNKVNLYKEICNIETRWYDSKDAPNNPKLSKEEIINLKDIHSALKTVKLMQPSGERYAVIQNKNLEGIAGGGKRKTQRKNK
jgi:hypothetical protein